jgi:hypothetical protein
VKCGWSIPDPVAPPAKMTKGPDGKPVELPAGPPPPPQPPTVEYCDGVDCPWDDDGLGLEEHMHSTCDVCGYEWLARPVDAT